MGDGPAQDLAFPVEPEVAVDAHEPVFLAVGLVPSLVEIDAGGGVAGPGEVGEAVQVVGGCEPADRVAYLDRLGQHYRVIAARGEGFAGVAVLGVEIFLRVAL